MKVFKERLYRIIFEADTPAGKRFDILLLWLIVFSILLIMLESIESIRKDHQKLFLVLEWIITILFTLEYMARIYTVRKPMKYIFSFYGIIDFLATLPMYLSLLISGTHVLLVIRTIRLLRVFRVLDLNRYTLAGREILLSIRKGKDKIIVFVGFVLTITVILGTLMYIIEGAESGFTSIPISMYWAIVTLTTVGFGDLTPLTPLGQFLAATVMIAGYGILATGFVSSNLYSNIKKTTNTLNCRNCLTEGHREGANNCFNCGEILNKTTE